VSANPPAHARRPEGGASAPNQGRTRKTAPPLSVVPLESAVRATLADVSDPEIPGLSIVDLGIVRDVQIRPGRIRVELLPTFIGCPAVELIREAVLERLAPFAATVEAVVTFAEPWTTDRITPQGRRTLSERGFAPPTALLPGQDLPLVPTLAAAPCPWCRSTNTRLENAFGATLCRAIAHCDDCLQPFEQFKSV
jgi:ring-1,2-phenylacetyl-CoA epoxidase subunit PaaD